jgi:GTP pyrophosphokinase
VFFDDVKASKKKKKKVLKDKPKLSREVVFDGVDEMPVKFATCCNPQSGQKIVGYVTRGSGISVHRKDCKVMLNGLSDRTIPVRWKGEDPELDLLDVNLCIELIDRVGFLYDVSQILTDEKVNIRDLSLDKNSGDKVKMRLMSISVENEDQLQRIMSKIERVESVIGVRRI